MSKIENQIVREESEPQGFRPTLKLTLIGLFILVLTSCHSYTTYRLTQAEIDTPDSNSSVTVDMYSLLVETIQARDKDFWADTAEWNLTRNRRYKDYLLRLQPLLQDSSKSYWSILAYRCLEHSQEVESQVLEVDSLIVSLDEPDSTFVFFPPLVDTGRAPWGGNRCARISLHPLALPNEYKGNLRVQFSLLIIDPYDGTVTQTVSVDAQFKRHIVRRYDFIHGSE